jgi:hypothetical protein
MRNLLCWCMIYKLRAFRRDTLLWISILNKISTPLPSSDNVQLQLLQLLLVAHNSYLLECLGDERPLARTWYGNLL